MQNKRLFGKICYLERQMCRESHQLFAEYGVSPVQMRTLIFIHVNELNGTAVCQKDIEKQLNLRASSVSTLLGNLEQDGFIARAVSDGDARIKNLTLTEKGKGVCEKNKLIFDKCDGVIQAALTEEEQKQFEALIEKIIKTISD